MLACRHANRNQQATCTASGLQTDSQAEVISDSSFPQINFAPSIAALMGVPIPFGNIGQISQELWAVAHSAGSSAATDISGRPAACQEVKEPYWQALTTNAAQVECFVQLVA